MLVTRPQGVIWILMLNAVAAAACGSDGGNGPDGGASAAVTINAPTQLTVAELAGGAHLTWKDNSDDEAGFVLERALNDGTFAAHKTLDFNTTQYHDAPLATGTSYRYRVAALAKGASRVLSTYSNEVRFTLPAGGGGGQPDAAGGGADPGHGGADAGHGGVGAEAGHGPAADAAVHSPDPPVARDAGHAGPPDAGTDAGHGGGHM